MPPVAPPLSRWEAAVEIFPAGWTFPAGPTWIAGWIEDSAGRVPTDLRGWIDLEPVLGLHGLPRPEIERARRGREGTPHPGFSFLLHPPRTARLLRIEALGEEGWTEFFRTPIRVDPAAPETRPPPPLARDFTAVLLTLLRLRSRHSSESWPALAREALARRLARPLESLPNPPFHGALEEPQDTGRLRYGRLSVSGWLAHRSARIVRLTASVDPARESVLLHGLPRAGIDRVFANLPGGETSQFLGHVELAPQAPVPVLLRVFAELDDGSRHLAFARRFEPRVVAGADGAPVSRSRRTFLRAVWALRGAARGLGVSSAGLGAPLATLQEAWSAYEAESPSPARRRISKARPLPPPTAASMRVLAVSHNLNHEGAPRFLLELARHLAVATDATVEVASPSEGPLRAAFETAGLPVRILDVSGALAARDAGGFRAQLARAAAGVDWERIDVVVANTMAAFWAVPLALAARKPVVLYVHESTPVRRFFEPLLAPALFSCVEEAFRRATRVVYTAESTRRVHAHLDEGNGVLLPSWIDLARIDAFVAAHPDRAALRRKHGLDPKDTLLINIGSLCERKGQHIYLRAAEILRDELRAAAGRRVRFVMVGARPGPYLEALRQEARAHGLDEVVFVDETGEIYDFYRLADIFVCTSFEESFPRVLLEAAAFRLPIVSTDVNGIAEMLRPDEAWLLPPGDGERLAAAIRSALAALAAGDHQRPRRAHAGITERYAGTRSLPQHAALIRAAASIR